MLLEIYAKDFIIIRDERAIVGDTFLLHARADTSLMQEGYHALFQNTGADTAEHMGACLTLDHNGVDALAVQQLRQKYPGGASADNQDLRSHVVRPPRW